jgi:dihydrofolate reductase
MRNIVVNTFPSLDGVMQAPGGPGEDPTGGFDLGGWSVNYWDDLMGQQMGETMGKPFDLLLGRKTYEIFARRRGERFAEGRSHAGAVGQQPEPSG